MKHGVPKSRIKTPPPPEAEAKTVTPSDVIWKYETYVNHSAIPILLRPEAIKAMKEYAELYSKKSEERVRELEGEVKELTSENNDLTCKLEDSDAVGEEEVKHLNARIKELEEENARLIHKLNQSFCRWCDEGNKECFCLDKSELENLKK